MLRKYVFTDRYQPLGILEERPNAFQDHEARAEHPAHLDEVENDLPLGVPIALALSHPAEGLAGETCRNEVGPHVLSPMGLELGGVAFCGLAMGVIMGRVVPRPGLLSG